MKVDFENLILTPPNASEPTDSSEMYLSIDYMNFENSTGQTYVVLFGSIDASLVETTAYIGFMPSYAVDAQTTGRTENGSVHIDLGTFSGGCFYLNESVHAWSQDGCLVSMATLLIFT